MASRSIFLVAISPFVVLFILWVLED